MFKDGMVSMIQKAKKMQEDMKIAQEEIKLTSCQGESSSMPKSQKAKKAKKPKSQNFGWMGELNFLSCSFYFLVLSRSDAPGLSYGTGCKAPPPPPPPRSFEDRSLP